MQKRILSAFAVCLFLLVVGAKWATFDRFGSPMPDWDQWDAEGGELLIPWLDGSRFLAHLFHPHNEHRVILTKLQNLTLALLNGQWDSRLEAVTNAVLHAILAVAFWVWGCRWVAPGNAAASAGTPPLGRGRQALLRGMLFILVLALFALPLAWQNVLGGFHSQQYWLLALSFAGLVTLPFARPWSAGWWAAGLATTFALGSMGSGFLAAAVVIVVVAWRVWRRETPLRAVWPTLAWMAALVAVGLITRVEVPWHADLKAKTLRDFVFSIVHSLQWPLRDRHWAAAVLWLPWLVVLVRVLRGTAMPSRAPQTIAALGGWVLVQLLATAYARGAGADYPASRYMDTLAFGTMANGLALAWLCAAGWGKTGRQRVTPVALALVWVATFAAGVREVAERNLRYELPDAKKYYIKAEGHMRRYLATDDPKALAYPDIPYPSAQGLIDRLAHRGLRGMMPVPLRAPLEVTPAASANTPDVFVVNDARSADPEAPPRDGLSPATPPLDAAKTWGSLAPGGVGASATGTWRSTPLQAPLGGWLKFETAGFLGEPNLGVRLELRDAATDRVLVNVRPSKIPGDSWRATYVRAPREPFVIVAEDRHAARWFAFSGPVEMGRMSYWAARATKHGLLLVYVAAAATVALAAYAWFAARGTHPATLSRDQPHFAYER